MLADSIGFVTSSSSASERPQELSIEQVVLGFRDPVSLCLNEAGFSLFAQRVGGAIGTVPPLYPEWLGCRTFTEAHGVRFPYVVGEMANGIASARLVQAAARAGLLAFFGAAGLPFERVQAAIDQLRMLDAEGLSWGMNLIHSPHEPALERRVSDLCVQAGVKRVSAAAYFKLTPAVVRYAYAGVRKADDGSIERKHHVFAKISRPEVARCFMEPAPSDMLDALVRDGSLSEDEARLARQLPVAEDITVESDSGGHTDNRPLAAIFPTIAALRDEIMQARGYTRPIRVGAAGGLGTPSAVAAAFTLGAAYVLTGSVNQACVESGLHTSGKEMLAKADVADMMMAPAADMFEMGVNLQVLKRGTMFGVRARKLFELYRKFGAIEDLPAADREDLEKRVLRESFDRAWDLTRAFWLEREPSQVARAETDPHHKMALVFRSYLGRASRWAIDGTEDRRVDFQIWCGPAMGAFNAWARGSFLESPPNRTVAQVALNLLEGAAAVTRAGQLRSFGVPVPASAFNYRPRRLQESFTVSERRP